MNDMLDEEEASKYRMFIGSMNRVVTLGRIDVTFAANTLVRYSCVFRNGPQNSIESLWIY